MIFKIRGKGIQFISFSIFPYRCCAREGGVVVFHQNSKVSAIYQSNIGFILKVQEYFIPFTPSQLQYSN